MVKLHSFPHTEDRRYMVMNGRLWRLANPSLAPQVKSHWVHELMSARRAVRAAQGDPVQLLSARHRVDVAKRALGERGPPWWGEAEPDFNGQLAKDTPYAAWFDDLQHISDQSATGS